MGQSQKLNGSTGLSRRDVLRTAGQAAAVGTLASTAIPHVHAGESNTINLALVGAGGRGTGAAANALSVTNAPTKLVAMADVFRSKLDSSYENLTQEFAEKPDAIDVPEDRRFVSFDGYKQAMDCLNPGDVVILATPPAFRWVHFTYAIERGLNVFMEKPVTVDAPSSRKMIELAKVSEGKGLKVGVGLMCRHCEARGELFDRIQNDEIGDLILLRAYRVVGPTASAFSLPMHVQDGGEWDSELLYQINRFHSFIWASGGAFSDFLIHNIDECCWMKNDFPVEAKGYGGRHYRGEYVDQNFDTYTVEYTFADGAKLMLEGRCMEGCDQEFASYAHGSKGSAVISASAHTPARSRIYKGQKFSRRDMTWAYPQPERNPYQLEWDNLIDAIVNDKPHNEVRRGAEASLVTAMGRMSCHTGVKVTRDDFLACDHDMAPTVNELSFEAAAPLQTSPRTGKYPIPMPGIITDQEYLG